jgi:CDGSH-type Zn-finger protein
VDEPIIASRKPFVGEIEPGEYWWCACGRSQNQPFCDGSHKGTRFSPICLTIQAPQRIALCNCKKTAKTPFCDGAHKDLPAEDG